jgi:hypothetical protein
LLPQIREATVLEDFMKNFKKKTSLKVLAP